MKVWWMVEIHNYEILLRKHISTFSIFMIRINQYEWLLCKKST